MKTEKELAQWLDDRHKRLTDIVDKALGYLKEKAKNDESVNSKSKKNPPLKYLRDSYLLTDQVNEIKKPPTPDFFLN